MNVLLLRPIPGNERFGLGPFFRIEPLGMEYIARALSDRGHQPDILDLRFTSSLERHLQRHRPRVVGIAAMHALETDDVLELAARVRRWAPDSFTVVGGHAAVAHPEPFRVAEVDAICLDDGERAFPLLVDALERGRDLSTVKGLLRREGDEFIDTGTPESPFNLDEVDLPLRDSVERFRREYVCLQYRPMWLLETARGCPFRCSFCSVAPMFDRSVRERSIDSVCRDFAKVGPNVFIADDLFWHHEARSRELAGELLRRGIRKRYLLVQSRVDLVSRYPELLQAWRPVADLFDIFFGFEAGTDEGLATLVKDTTIDRTEEALRVCREQKYGITGNFVIDPDWDESDFERLWEFVAAHRLSRAGFTILTPLPGTPYFDQMRSRIRAESWSQFDMHHLLWEPQLGPRRFFELYCETWRRSVLNLKGEKKWWKWARQTKVRDFLFLAKMILRTQSMMRPESYLAEHRLTVAPFGPAAQTDDRTLRLA
jgi:hopanoid C-3 methylase